MDGTAVEDESTKDPGIEPSVLQDLIQRAKQLLAELEAFRAHLKGIREEQSVEIAHFRGTVQSELGMLERLSLKPENDAAKHIARSSNLPFLEAVWNSAKRSNKLVALQKRVFANGHINKGSLIYGMRGVELNGLKAGDTSHRHTQKADRDSSAVVDLISTGGLHWTKVSLITNTRLLFDLAKQGWESPPASDDEEDEFLKGDESDDDRDVPLLKTAKDLAKAAQAIRVRTKHPKVTMILPRIVLGETAEVDSILDSIRAAGVEVQCGDQLQATPTLDEAINFMAEDKFATFTETLNIDCTILLAVVSEFSHASVSKQPWFHTALQRQVEVEGNENLLPSILYPAMSKHTLVCTREAATRMREIVDTIGTPSEKARTSILMADDTSKTRDELLDEMRSWSAYPVPEDWQLPIKTVEFNHTFHLARLPPQASLISEQMTAINQSVFLYGWAMGCTTITSNRTVVKQIENHLGQTSELEEKSWPNIWLCPTARSLVGKEKRGAKKSDDEKRDQKARDHLKREEFRRNGLDVLSKREGREVEDFRPNGYTWNENADQDADEDADKNQ